MSYLGKVLLSLTLTMITFNVQSTTLHVGSGQTYSSFSQAANDVLPGDTILIHGGVYGGGTFVADLQGTSSAWITILPSPGDTVIYQGGNTGWQLSDAAYLRIYNLIFEQQTANGFNLDDGGTYSTPSHHILFEGCIFRDMNATGNNDLLKLSGLDTFEVRNCIFLNGSAGGSGIDMVGCHNGIFENCYFENMGSNAIQAKGGTQYIRIERNFFKNCGQRTLNLGGLTGLQFFRPINATFEAADLQVFSNIFIGLVAPIAYVGSIRVDVVNNTIYQPTNWVVRILQETVDTTRFAKCGNNTFRNNIIYRGNLSTDCNVGPNTDPQSFHFSNNLWYHFQNTGWSGPVLPVVDSNNIVGADPLFTDSGNEDFSILTGSQAIGNGYPVSDPKFDYAGNPFNTPRTIGAFEGNLATYTKNQHGNFRISVYPNPFHDVLNVYSEYPCNLTLFDLAGRIILTCSIIDEQSSVNIRLPGQRLFEGMYLIKAIAGDYSEEIKVILK